MATMVEGELIMSQEIALHAGAGFQRLELFSAAFPDHKQRSGCEVEPSGHELAPLRDVGIYKVESQRKGLGRRIRGRQTDRHTHTYTQVIFMKGSLILFWVTLLI